MSVKRLILVAAATGALAGAVFVAFIWNAPSRPSPGRTIALPEAGAPHQESPLPSDRPLEGAAVGVVATPRSVRAVENRDERDSRWKAFREKFGADLRGEFHGGRLVSLQGALGVGAKAGADFDSTDPRQVSARAREILAASRDLLGVTAEPSLAGPKAIPGPASAQAVFRQTVDGVPLAPQGAITMDFGPQGELLGMDSSYLPSVQVTNSVRLNESQAREKAVSAIHDAVESGMKTEGGSRLVWVTEPAPEGRAAVARHAYEYSVQGRQVLVDAGDGSIIATRDRRHL